MKPRKVVNPIDADLPGRKNMTNSILLKDIDSKESLHTPDDALNKYKAELKMSREEGGVTETIQAREQIGGGQMIHAPPGTLPDVNMVETLISNDGVPEKVQEEHWDVFTRDKVLGFTDNVDAERNQMGASIQNIHKKCQQPYYSVTWEWEERNQQIKNIIASKDSRTRGHFDGRKNERTLIASSLQETKQIQMMESPHPQRESFMKRLLGRR